MHRHAPRLLVRLSAKQCARERCGDNPVISKWLSTQQTENMEGGVMATMPSQARDMRTQGVYCTIPNLPSGVHHACLPSQNMSIGASNMFDMQRCTPLLCWSCRCSKPCWGTSSPAFKAALYLSRTFYILSPFYTKKASFISMHWPLTHPAHSRCPPPVVCPSLLPLLQHLKVP